MYVQNSINGNTWANSYSSDIYNESYFYDANGNITNLSRKDKDGNYLDNMTYNYQAGTNKLNYIADPYHPTSVDIEGQSANNYTYDAIGNLTQDVKGGLSSIVWNPYGKITHISKGSNGNLYYDYDAMGNRIKKSFTQSDDNTDKTWYVRDASGNIMAIYSWKNYGTNQQVLLENYELYGSDRLGSLNLGIPVEGDYNLTPTTNYTRLLGLKQYEISNHLGNVLTTFSDQRVFAPAGMSSTNSNALIAKLISAQDYYPFGMLMDGRSWNTDKVKFGFNGKENDNEVKGIGNQQDYGMRIYDPRIGKFLSVDPLTKQYPMLTPYQFGSNRPIDGIDIDGKEWFGCTSIISYDITAVAGIGYGVKLSIQLGNAYDMIGTTQYIAYSALCLYNQDLDEGTLNPQFLLGGEASANVGAHVVKEPTFSEAFSNVSYSMSSVSAKAGLGGSVSVSNSGGGVSIGFGIGGHFETGNNTRLIESISITSEERENTTLGSFWFVGLVEPTKDAKTGEITGYEAQLYEFTLGSITPQIRLTGIKVSSDVVKTKVKNKDTGKTEIKYSAKGNWRTEKYKTEEKKQKH